MVLEGQNKHLFQKLLLIFPVLFFIASAWGYKNDDSSNITKMTEFNEEYK